MINNIFKIYKWYFSSRLKADISNKNFSINFLFFPTERASYSWQFFILKRVPWHSDAWDQSLASTNAVVLLVEWESHFEFRINECTTPSSFYIKHNLWSHTGDKERGENSPRKILSCLWHTHVKHILIFGPLVFFAVIVEVRLLVTVMHSNLTRKMYSTIKNAYISACQRFGPVSNFKIKKEMLWIMVSHKLSLG